MYNFTAGFFYWPRKARKIFRRDTEMIIIVKPDAKEERIHDLVKWIEAQGLRTHLSKGDYTTIIGVIGDISKLDDELLSGLDIVESVKHVSEPFKNANRKFQEIPSARLRREGRGRSDSHRPRQLRDNRGAVLGRERGADYLRREERQGPRARSRLSPSRRASRPRARRCCAAARSSRARRPTTSRGSRPTASTFCSRLKKRRGCR